MNRIPHNFAYGIVAYARVFAFAHIIVVCCIFACFASCNCAEDVSAPNLADNYAFKGLYAPWDSLENGTEFSCRCDNDYFYFKYVAEDTTPIVSEDFPSERTVDDEDRVEIFFCPDREMHQYYAAEIDSRGRIMDYSAQYYRNFDFEWNFRTLQTIGDAIYDSGDAEGCEGAAGCGNAAGCGKAIGYKVTGKVSLAELRELGIPTDGTVFWIGLFQADFTSSESVNWFSRVKTCDKSPDFHKPDVLFPVKICPKEYRGVVL